MNIPVETKASFTLYGFCRMSFGSTSATRRLLLRLVFVEQKRRVSPHLEAFLLQGWIEIFSLV
jgi:hypothetical protein